MDSHFLIPLRERIKQELIEAGRLALAEEDFHRLERTPVPQSNGDNCWKLSGKQDLTPQQVAVLHRLYEYRENQARKANLPPFKVISNETLVAIAQASPTNELELEEITELSPRLRQRHASGLLESIKQGLRSEPPRRPSYPRKDDKLIERYDALKSWRKKTAGSYKVESDVILPREVMEQVAAVNPRTQSELAALMVNFPERLNIFGKDILLALKPKEPQ